MPTASKGRIHGVFNDNLTQLADQARRQAEAARGTGQRPWNRPDDAPDPLDVPGTTAAFDRADANANFEELVADGAAPGTGGDVVSVKTQVDYVGVMERAFRARHCTPIRSIALAIGRRKGHGKDNGVLLGGVLRYAQDALKAGTP